MALFLRVVNKLTDTFSTTIYFRMVVFLHNDNSFCFPDFKESRLSPPVFLTK